MTIKAQSGGGDVNGGDLIITAGTGSTSGRIHIGPTVHDVVADTADRIAGAFPDLAYEVVEVSDRQAVILVDYKIPSRSMKRLYENIVAMVPSWMTMHVEPIPVDSFKPVAAAARLGGYGAMEQMIGVHLGYKRP